MEKQELDALLPVLKRKLRIDEADEASDAKLEDMLADVDVQLRDALAVNSDEFSFAAAGPERSLLLNLCFYEFNDAADEFWANYAQDVATVRTQWMVRQHAEEQEDTDVR